MAAAQRKRWQLLKVKKAEAAKPKHKKAAKRRKANVTESRKPRPFQGRLNSTYHQRRFAKHSP
jgi:hypothetical protein